MKKQVIFIFILLKSICLFCEENDYAFVKKAINQFWSTLPYGTNWTLSCSSVLKEKNKTSDFYDRDKAFDNNLDFNTNKGIHIEILVLLFSFINTFIILH